MAFSPKQKVNLLHLWFSCLRRLLCPVISSKTKVTLVHFRFSCLRRILCTFISSKTKVGIAHFWFSGVWVWHGRWIDHFVFKIGIYYLAARPQRKTVFWRIYRERSTNQAHIKAIKNWNQLTLADLYSYVDYVLPLVIINPQEGPTHIAQSGNLEGFYLRIRAGL